MEGVILCGIQGSGKTTLYHVRYLETHVGISLDLLRTRHREQRFLAACLETQMPFVVDKTNETREERARYVGPARAAGYRVIAVLVDVAAEVAIARQALRPPKRRIPVAGILGTRKRFEPPSAAEGFDEIYTAHPDPEAPGGWTLAPLSPPAG